MKYNSYKKYFQMLIGLCVLAGGLFVALYMVWATSSMEFRFNNALKTQFGSGIFTYSSDLDFKYGGNQRVGFLFSRNLETLSTPEVVDINGTTGSCTSRIRGLYYNNQRGERVRPLDKNTLTGLQAIDSSYNALQLTGGLFTNCTGFNGSGYVYGQLTLIYATGQYYLIAGTDYNFTANVHGSTMSGSLQRSNNALSGYIRDNYGGIGQVTTTLWIVSGSTQLFTGTLGTGESTGINYTIIVINSTVTEGMTGSLTIGNATGIMASGSSWTGIINPPTFINANSGQAASNSELAGILFNDGTNYLNFHVGANNGASLYLLPSGTNFQVSVYVSTANSGKVLTIYRSSDGTGRAANTPDATCTIDANKYCTFMTNHLSYFTVFAPTDGNKAILSSNQSCGDHDGCTCNGDVLGYGGNCTILSNGGGSYRLTKDNCKRTPTNLHNLSGANADGIDYSKSYYDKDCGSATTPESKIDVLNIGGITGSPYSYDLNQAYLYAYNIGITTSPTIQGAAMKSALTRKDLAKMISSYAIVVLGVQPDTGTYKRCDKFTDIKNLDSATQRYITLSCQLGLMGLGADGIHANANFFPNKTLTRANFSAILSRLLFADRYNGGQPYYQKHLAGLKTHGIVKNTDYPQMTERKGYVMLMLMRADKKEIGRAKYHAAPSENGMDALLQ